MYTQIHSVRVYFNSVSDYENKQTIITPSCMCAPSMSLFPEMEDDESNKSNIHYLYHISQCIIYYGEIKIILDK